MSGVAENVFHLVLPEGELLLLVHPKASLNSVVHVQGYAREECAMGGNGVTIDNPEVWSFKGRLYITR